MRLSTLLKAKYIKKYREASGKMVYIYNLPGGRRVSGRADEQAHSLATITAMYKRRAPGQGTAKSINSKADLDIILSQTTFCMISAGRNPQRATDVGMSDRAVKIRDIKLRSDLVKAGYIFTPAKGKYGASEESVFVMCHDANKSELMRIGAKYKQDSILYVDKGNSSLIKTHGEGSGEAIMKGSGHEYVDADDYYTEVDIAGKPVKFSMNLSDIVKSIMRLVILLNKGK